MTLIALNSDHCLVDMFKNDQPKSAGLNQLQKAHQPKMFIFLKWKIFCHLEVCPNNSVAAFRRLRLEGSMNKLYLNLLCSVLVQHGESLVH